MKELLYLSILFSGAVNFDLLIIISMRFENANAGNKPAWPGTVFKKHCTVKLKLLQVFRRNFISNFTGNL